jgi:DNA-binding transcriptional ArsR family regulator
MVQQIPEQFLEMMAERFRLLGDATRMAIVRCLLKEGEQNVGRVVEATGRGQANVSKHLKQLHRAGMVSRRKEGLQVYYQLSDPVVEKLCRLVCESLLEEMRPELAKAGQDVSPDKVC